MKRILLLLLIAVLALGVTAFGVRRCAESDGTDAFCFSDDEEMHFGTGLDADIGWFTDDANAHYLGISLPTGGATSVPVLGVGIGLDGEDLGLFDGETFPGIFLMDADGDSYVALTWADDDSPEIEVGGEAASITIPGVAVGSDVQAWDAQLDDIAALVQSDSYIIVGDDTNWVQETGDDARASLGLAIDTDVQAHSDDLDTIATAASTATNEGVLFVGQFTITYEQTDSYTVCTVPANADVTKIEVLTTTTFTGGSATTIDIGWLANLDSYTDDLAVQTAGYTVATGYSAMGDVGETDRDVLAQITTDQSAGAIVVLVYWTTGAPGTP